MNRAVIRMAGCALALFMLFQISGCAGKRSATARDPKRFIREHDLTHLPKFDIPMDMNDRVVAWLEYFQGPGSGHFRRYLERSGRYMPLMQEILKKHGLPRDLIYVALIESGFNTQARSWASAVGPWQFIQSTGRLYGLKIDGWVDERRDPYKSTIAAANFFRDLYDEFGDWYLAMAAYNGGPARVRQAIESTGSKNFWELADDRRAFRAETRDYVPKFIAAAIMAKMPERFGFHRVEYKDPFDFDRGTVETQTDLAVIAKCAGASEGDIVDLNPHLVRGATPPDARNYEIRLPKGTSHAFAGRYAALPKEERIQIARYTTRPGDTLSRIARRYGVSAAHLASINNLKISRRPLKAGLTLTIPPGGSARYAAVSDDGPRESGRKRVIHTMKRGETLTTVARRYGVTGRQIASWNNIRKNHKVRAGTKLVIRVPREKVAQEAEDTGVAGKEYRVQRGDTLSTIARRYGVTVKHLMAMNDIASPKNLRPGMKIVVHRAGASPDRPMTAAMDEAKIQPDEKGKSVEHKVEGGETLGAIAKRYNVSAKELMAANNIKNPRALRAGTKLVIGVRAPAERRSDEMPEEPAAKGHPMRSEEMSVAQAAAFTPKENDEANQTPASGNLSDSPAGNVTSVPSETDGSKEPTFRGKAATPVKLATIGTPTQRPPQPAGQDVKEAGPKGSVVYKVKSGDTLWDIARRHKVSIADIQRLNNLSDPSSVRPGTAITIK